MGTSFGSNPGPRRVGMIRTSSMNASTRIRFCATGRSLNLSPAWGPATWRISSNGTVGCGVRGLPVGLLDLGAQVGR